MGLDPSPPPLVCAQNVFKRGFNSHTRTNTLIWYALVLILIFLWTLSTEYRAHSFHQHTIECVCSQYIFSKVFMQEDTHGRMRIRCVCVCVCLCVWFVCVCVCLFVCVTCVYVKLYAPYIIESVYKETRVWSRACQICLSVRMQRMCLCMCGCMCVWTCVHPYVYTYICMSIYPSIYTHILYLRIYVECVCMSMHLCTCIYKRCVHAYTHKYTQCACVRTHHSKIRMFACMCACACTCNMQKPKYAFKSMVYTSYPRTDLMGGNQMPATHCNTLQHTATHCNTLQHTATHCNTLQHTATHCYALPQTATRRNVM